LLLHASFCSLAWLIIRKMEAAYSSEISVVFQRATLRYILEERALQELIVLFLSSVQPEVGKIIPRLIIG
jgi:hypothetical protein